MTVNMDPWRFEVDLERTMEHSRKLSQDHCECGYCRNYYQSINTVLPSLEAFLSRFGVKISAPVELMPIEPTLYLLGYRVYGNVKRMSDRLIYVDGVPIRISPEAGDRFRLEFGPIVLPWVVDEDPEDVISPANEPEFMDQMYKKLLMLSQPFDVVTS